MNTTKEKINYIDDKILTNILLKEIHKKTSHLPSLKKLKKHPVPSDDLTNAYMNIMKGILKKPNFSGYYEEVKENIFSKCQIVFLLNWYKFKPYRVRNNFKISHRAEIISENSDKGFNFFHSSKPIDKYSMLIIRNRTFTIENCEKISDDSYKITMFNKLKDPIFIGDEVTILNPKTDFDAPEADKLNGAFSFFSLFVFTAAKDEITSYKEKRKKVLKYLENKESSVNVTNGIYTEEEI